MAQAAGAVLRIAGAVTGGIALIQDVTEQVRAKREIEGLAQMMAERSARLDSILGSMTDGLWVYDANGDVVDVNQAALNMFGLASRAEAVLKYLQEGGVQNTMTSRGYGERQPIAANNTEEGRLQNRRVVLRALN